MKEDELMMQEVKSNACGRTRTAWSMAVDGRQLLPSRILGFTVGRYRRGRC